MKKETPPMRVGMLLHVRYLMWRLFLPMLVVSLSLTTIAWLTQALRFIDMIVNRGLDIGTFLYISALTLPALLWVVLPISLLITTLMVYHRLAQDSELVALKASGLSRLQLLAPVLYFSAGVAGIILALGVYLLPASYREFKDIQNFIRDNYASVLLQEGVFSSPSESLTVYIEDRDKQGRLKGIMVQDSRDAQRPVTFMAQEGKFLPSQSGSPRILLVHGTQQQMDAKTNTLQILYFDSYVLDIKAFGATLQEFRWREPQERFLPELFFPTDTLQDHLKYKLWAEGHHRITWPLYVMFFGVLGTVPFMAGQFNRRGYTRKIALTVASGAGVMVLAITLNNLTAQIPMVAVLVYGMVIAANSVVLNVVLSSHHRGLAYWLSFRFLKSTV